MQETNYGIHTAPGGITVSINECKHFAHASVIISDTGDESEILREIFLFNFALGSIMTRMSRRRLFKTLSFSVSVPHFISWFYKTATSAAAPLTTNSPHQSGAFGIQALSTFTAVLPLPVVAERMKGIPRRQECTEEHLLPHRVHRLLTAWEAHSPRTAVLSTLAWFCLTWQD